MERVISTLEEARKRRTAVGTGRACKAELRHLEETNRERKLIVVADYVARIQIVKATCGWPIFPDSELAT